MKYTYSILIFFVISCSDESKQTKSSIFEKKYPLEGKMDSLQNIEREEERTSINDKELIIYPFFQNFEKENYGFIPLTENYSWSEHPDSLMVSNKYLDKQDVPDNYRVINYHLLNKEKRQQFLLRSDIKEDDNIFIYNLTLDSLEIHNVNQMNLCAFIPYGHGGLPQQYDYQVGFEMTNSSIFGLRTNDCLVYVGNENPFIQHSIKPMIWSVIDSTNFPINKSKINLDELGKYSTHFGTYKFETEKLEYYLQELGNKKMSKRHLIILDKKTKEIKRSILFRDTEGIFLTPLNGMNEDYINETFQWTGQLFKNKPPIVFGFIGMSFGCPKIHYIDNEYNYSTDLHLKCDNRH